MPQPKRRKERPQPRRSSAERDAEVRAKLEPYGPGERPPVIVVAVVVAAALALINLGLMLGGFHLRGHGAGAGRGGTIAFVAVMLVAAAGMWRMRYWAVLGFQALLALTILIAAMALVIASNVAALLLCVVVIAGGGWLFWKLVRVLSRLQAPPRPHAGRPID